MGIHELPKAHSLSPYLFPISKGPLPFTSFYFLELITYCVPLSASLKLVSTIFINFFFFPANDSPSKTMKNAFYFT